MDREFDLLLFGATGFTGKLCAEYIQACGPSGLQWGLAGRNLDRLRASADGARNLAESRPVFRRLRENGMSEGVGAPEPLAFIEVDIAKDDLEAVVRRATVVISTAGPFALIGKRLVSACAAVGTHYVDITGESHFTKWSMLQNSGAAESTGAVIIHQCGFDSIPSDFSAFLAAQELLRRNAGPAAEIRASVKAAGGISGGTIASILEFIALPYAVNREISSPLYLVENAEYAATNKDGGDRFVLGKDSWTSRWTAPWLMAAPNRKIVHRTASLLGPEGGFSRSMRYGESMAASSFVSALLANVALVIFFLLLVFPPTRWVLKKFALPRPGQGPSRKSMENGFFSMEARARPAPSHDGEPTFESIAKISLRLDPGYLGTALMLCESALVLVDNKQVVKTGGVYTPAVALGDSLVRRFREAGFTIEASSRQI